MSSLPLTGDDATLPFYVPLGDECEIFEQASRLGIAVLLKGPTGCGKTRFVEHMTARLGRPLFTVACHDDLTASDLTGRFLLRGDETVWADGPLTHAVREGGICYLDEVVEARKDVTVVLHPLTDDRRMLPLERTGERLKAPPNFMLVASYNPGYQNLTKTLKPSTRQRFLALELGFPPADVERRVIVGETGLDEARAAQLVELAGRLRGLRDVDLEEGVSTRLLVYCARLMHAGVATAQALEAAIIQPLSDDDEVRAGVREAAQAILG